MYKAFALFLSGVYWVEKEKPIIITTWAVAERLVPGGVSHRVSGQSKSEVVPAVNLSYKGKGLIINEKDYF